MLVTVEIQINGRASDSWSERSWVRSPAEWAGISSSPESTFCSNSCFDIRSSPVFVLARKRPRSFWREKGLGGRLLLNIHATFTQQSQNGLTMPYSHSVGTHQTNEPTRNSPGNARPQSSHLAENCGLIPGLKSAVGTHKLSSTYVM